MIRKILSSVLLILLLLLAAVSLVPKAFGLKAMSVSTGSMSPSIPKGSLILIKPVDFGEISVGDVLTFEKSDKSIRFTHRVVSVVEEAQLIYTKGDANNVEDPMPSPYENCVGRVEKHIPLLGFISAAVNAKYAIPIIVLIYAVWIAFEIEIFGAKKKAKKSEVAQ